MKRFALCMVVSWVGVCVQASGQSGLITTVAGTGSAGFAGDSGPAAAAQLWAPASVAVDASGNLYIADYDNERVREVSASGIITTLAGNGIATYAGDGGPATAASLYFPNGVAVDKAGNVYIADSADSLIREVSTTGTITTFAGNGTQGFGGDGGKATAASLSLGVASGVAVDAAGNVYIADSANNRVRKVSAGGVISTVAGGATAGYTGDGGPATTASLNVPVAVAVDASGNLYIADQANSVIRKVSTSGVITTAAGNGTGGFGGDGGPATAAQLYMPSGVALDSSGNLYIADYGNYRVRIVSGSTITTYAGNGVEAYAGDGGPATSASLAPTGVAVDAAGNLYVADQNNNRIRKVAPSTVLPPAITTGGVVPIYSNVSTIQQDEWVSIYGSNLASGSATWNGNFPTSLAGTSVTIDGKPAFFWSVSPTQINVQAPDDPTFGIVPVTVSNANGSFTSMVTLAEEAPQFSLLDNRHVAGIILRSNGSGAYAGGTYDILGPTGNSLGYPTVAAKAGDNVELFGVGFGPTTPAVPAGQTFSGAAPTNKAVVLRINFNNVTPAFSGLVSAGLYQINFTVPAGLGTGDVLLTATAGVTQTPLTAVISLQ